MKFINQRGWHPVGIGLSAYLLTLLAFNVSDSGVLRTEILSDVIVTMTAVALAALCAGWFWTNQHMTEAGLLLAGVALVTRSAFLLLQEWSTIGVWLGMSVAVIAIGSYVKEGHAHQREILNVSGV